jgi:Ni,Fe-hydrogenase I small subunit
MGCKGPVTYHNCPAVRYNDGTNWPVGSGHGCIGCSEPAFWEWGAYKTVQITGATPPAFYPPVETAEEGLSPGTAGVLGGLAGVAVGAAAVAAAQQVAKSGQGQPAQQEE